MNTIPSLSWVNMPSAFRGAARTMDMFGKLDEYKTNPSADQEMIKNDWANVGNDLTVSIVSYEQAQKQEKACLADTTTSDAA